MKNIIVVAVVYKEAYWMQTKECLDKLSVPVHFVDRHGTGSLAKALNLGFLEHAKDGVDFVWFVTNIVFPPNTLTKLAHQMEENTNFAGITPSFESDHLFTRSNGTDEVTSVPFVEFTAPIVRADIFKQYLLDEKMPYWGHDLDWGFRVREAGFNVGVHNGIEVSHVYIRNSNLSHPITAKRMELRKSMDSKTTAALRNKYGKNWREKVWLQKV